jgi:hypothetical protein
MEATLLISGSNYATLYQTSKLYYILERLLQQQKLNYSNDVTMWEGLEKALTKLQQYYDKASVVSNIATILDPRKNVIFLKSLNWEDEWIEGIISSLKDAFAVYQGNETMLETISTPPKSKPVNSFLSDILEEIETETPITEEKLPEIDRYIALGKVETKLDPLSWWKTNAQSFPVLSKIARDYLAAPASSVPCEEAFSSGVDLVTPNRNRLSEESIEAAMCLKYWMKFLK